MEGLGGFNWATSAISGALNMAGGFLQASEIRRQTELRLEQMRKQAASEIGGAEARAGASGVEMQSLSVQGHLQRMRSEWSKRIAEVQRTGSNSADLAGLSGFMTGMNSFAQNLSALNKTNDLLRPADNGAELDAGAAELNSTLGWSWDR